MRTLISLVVAFAAAASTWAYSLSVDGSGVYVNKWRTSPIHMIVKLPTAPTLTDGGTFSSSVIAGMQAWNAQLGAVQFAWQTSAPGSYANGNKINEVVVDDTADGDEFPDGMLAITIMYFAGNEFIEADVIFNAAESWDSYRGSRNGRGGREDVRRVAVHELGHALGLDHPDEAGQFVTAIMNARVSDIDSLRSDDIAGGRRLYGAPGFVPANDAFVHATTIVLEGGVIELAGANIAATREANEPAHADVPTGQSVWWKWTAPSSGAVRLTTLGSDYDTVLAVYTGGTLSGLTEVVSNDDEETPEQNETPQRKRTSRVSFNARKNVTYRIAVDGWGDEESPAYWGNITLGMEFTPAAQSTTRLVALAARAAAGSGDQTLIMGFVVEGNKEVLVQGVGPGIAGSVPTALTDPRLELFRYQGGTFAKVDENNDWVNSSAITEARARLGASALAVGSKDAALLKTIAGGVYTAHVASGGAAGVALVEAYDADGGGSSRLMALSTRTVAGAGDATLIAGFVLEGNGPKTVLIRGLGPELAGRGVNGVLADPRITVYRGSNVVGSNDDWGGSAELKEAFSAVGAEQLASGGSKDAAMLVTLDPGAYTVHVTGAAGTTGVALVEIFDVP